ncbi:sugar ABC transporter substrate-binding protein [Amycolatopsis sp. H20-H5]|uniref:sugar ABC transporter substrate-binding protein n=1 Tax=Amycolatopsis sp. H20-H5 TaxID=3046309 RepID=UPI002DBC9B38|nr:substrate-binding domain-containing protein [Amycolatopsis sp. H20-H5]MEC3975736.1 substrate-binding domain-containing protein [Amycolatopsis sp. H20-H5]
MSIAKPKAQSRRLTPGLSGVHRALGTLSIAVVMAASLTACGSSGTGSGAAAGSANADAARQAIAAYTSGKASPFVVDQPLSKPVPPGTNFAFLQCAAQACSVAGREVQAAVRAIGGTVTIVNSGSSAQTAQSAASAVLAMKPAAVIATGLDPQIYGGGLQRIADAGIKIVTISVSVDTKPFGITANYLGAPTFVKAGGLLADWVIANKGPGAKVAFYGVPEISFVPAMIKGFEDELKKNCSSCESRTVNVALATLGTSAPQTVVTDLQSHPDTTIAVMSTGTLAAGVPAAMSSAGIDVSTLLYAPQAGNLQDIKDGKIDTALAIDYNSSVWAGVDVAARLVLGDQPLKAEADGEASFGFLGQKDITFDPAKGWNPYPDYAQRYAKLWLKS